MNLSQELTHRYYLDRSLEALKNPSNYEWSFSGLGFIRCKLEPNVRLHLWYDHLRIQDVTEIHTHPWNFTSYILAGDMMEFIYTERPNYYKGSVEMYRDRIECGENAHVLATVPKQLTREVYSYSAGEQYSHLHSDIHSTHAANGTITVIERQPTEDPDHAYTYRKRTDFWQNAQIHKISPSNIRSEIDGALVTLNDFPF